MRRSIADVVVPQHAEEAAFLWLLRDVAVDKPNYRLADLAKLDARVEAHLDGLRVAGNEGWRIMRAELARKEPGELFAAAVLAFESDDAGRVDDVLRSAAAKPTLGRAAASALAWIKPQRAVPYLGRLLADASPVLRRIGIAGSAAGRLIPREALTAALASDDVPLKARALKAVGELGLVELLPQLRGELKHADVSVRFHAAWSAALLAPADRDTVRTLQHTALDVPRYRRSAAQMLLRRVDPAAGASWLAQCFSQSKLQRLAIAGYGALGDPAAIPRLLPLMTALPWARAAGDAFSMITGVDLAYQNLDRKPPADFVAGPTEDPGDPRVAPDPDDSLPWPEADKVARWWSANQGRFASGRRYLAGELITARWALDLLRTGYQRQRAAAAVELAIAAPGKALFEVRAAGDLQQRQLANVPS